MNIHYTKIFGHNASVLIPMVMLLLLVCSAALTGILVFGQPVIWYLDGKKKDAYKLLITTLGILFCVTIGEFIALYIISRK